MARLDSPLVRSFALALAVVASPASAAAASYVDTPPLARTSVGVSLLAGTPLGSSDADARASVLGGGGSELALGVAWESGWALHALFGAARWSSRGALAQTLRDRDAALLEGWTGLGVRRAFGDGEVAPFLGASLLADLIRVRGENRGDATGLAAAARVGVRYRDVPWTIWAAVDLRHARLSAPYDDAERIVMTRLAIVFGVDLEGGLR